MENENKGNGLQLPVGEALEPEISTAESGASPRSDAHVHAKTRLDYTPLSTEYYAKPLLEALARRGENIRQLRVIERMLREKLQIDGILAELLFDHAWSSFLRCVLIARTEARALTSQGPPSDLSFIPNLPKLPKSDFSFDDISALRLQQLPLL